MTSTDADDTMPNSEWFIEIRSLVMRLERTLGAGERSTVALTASQRVARGLSFGLNSRALAVGALLDVPEAAAGAYDCIRSMAEACAHLSWLHDGPGDREQRARCLQLGHARIDAENRAKVLATHEAPLVPADVRTHLERQCADTQRVLDQARKEHGVGCELCKDQGQTYRVRAWLERRATSPSATDDDLNLYAGWVAASADAHQLSPTRWWNAERERYELELSRSTLLTIANTMTRCFLFGWAYVFALLRPEASREIETIKAELRATPRRQA